MNKMFHKIDSYSIVRKGPQTRRQTKERANGLLSTRVTPLGMPSWSVIVNQHFDETQSAVQSWKNYILTLLCCFSFSSVQSI